MKKSYILILSLIVLVLALNFIFGNRINYSEGAYNYNSVTALTSTADSGINMIEDKETATKVAQAIIQGLHSRGYVTDYHIAEIHHDTENEIWIVTCKPREFPFFPSAGTYYNFSLDSKTGAVVESWHS